MENKKEEKSKTKKYVFILIGITMFLLILFIISSVPYLRPKTFCKKAEVDANNIAAAISEYLSFPEHRGSIPTQLDIEELLNIKSPWKLTTCGDTFYIHVVDRSGKCPAEYQNKDPDWNSNIYTLKF